MRPIDGDKLAKVIHEVIVENVEECTTSVFELRSILFRIIDGEFDIQENENE